MSCTDNLCSRQLRFNQIDCMLSVISDSLHTSFLLRKYCGPLIFHFRCQVFISGSSCITPGIMHLSLETPTPGKHGTCNGCGFVGASTLYLARGGERLILVFPIVVTEMSGIKYILAFALLDGVGCKYISVRCLARARRSSRKDTSSRFFFCFPRGKTVGSQALIGRFETACIA